MFTAPLYLLIAVIGLWFAIKRRSSFPKASLFAFVGFGILAAYNLLGSGIMLWWVFNAPGPLPELTLATVADKLTVLAATTTLGLAVFLDREGRDATHAS